jgi:EmrB/QacA subfamily drug resistance transporter
MAEIMKVTPEPEAGAVIPAALKRQIYITFSGVLLAIFLSTMDDTIVATALPRILADLGGFAHYTLVTTAYLITSTIMIPITGKLTDLFGRKWFYTAGLVIFIVGSMLSGTSRSLTELIIFRGFQGIGGGVMISNAFAVIGDLFPPAERGKYQGYIAAVFAVAAVIGPFLGGFITDRFSWHWIFYINVPLGIVVILLFIYFFPKPKPFQRQTVDYAGIALLVATTAPFLLALSWGGADYAWSSPVIIGLLLFSFMSLIAFYLTEVRTREPILPMRYFTNRIVSVSLAVTFFTGFVMYSAIIFVPLYFQGVRGLSPTQSGGSLTPMLLGVAAGALISGQLMSRAHGHYKILGTCGIIVMAAGTGLLVTLRISTGFPYAVGISAFTGLGLGLTLPLYSTVVQNVTPYNVMGVMISSVPFSRFIGGSVGLAIMGSVMNNRFYGLLSSSLPTNVQSQLPSGLLASLAKNPQVLVSSQAQDILKQALSGLGAQAEPIYLQVLAALRTSLMSALNDVFLVMLGISILCLVIELFIKEVPLRKGNAPIMEI